MFRNTWHFFHFVMTIITGGLWVFVWMWRAWSNRQHNERVFANMSRGGQQSTVVNVTTPGNLTPEQLASIRVQSGQTGRVNLDLLLILGTFAALFVVFAACSLAWSSYHCRNSFIGFDTRYGFNGCEIRVGRGWVPSSEARL